MKGENINEWNTISVHLKSELSDSSYEGWDSINKLCNIVATQLLQALDAKVILLQMSRLNKAYAKKYRTKLPY